MRTAGSEADGTWEGDVVLPLRAHWFFYSTTVTATDAASNATTRAGNNINVTWYEPYRPDVRFVDAFGTANDRVLHDSHGRMEAWSVLGPVERLTEDSYKVTAAGQQVMVNVFVPKGSSMIISQDGSMDRFAATQVGRALLAKPGSWTPGTRLSVQWLRNGKTIKGATSTRYTAVAADQDKPLQVRVTGRKAGMLPVTRTSASTARVRARVPKVRRASSWHAFASPDERNSSIRLGDRAPATGQQ